jgi:hypothetical protein
MADDVEKIEKVAKKVSKPKTKYKTKKSVAKLTFILKEGIRYGSKKDGTPKKVYKKGDKIKLDAKKEKLYKSLNLI